MKVKSRRNQIVFRGRPISCVQQRLKGSNETISGSSNPRRMTSAEDAIPTALDEPVGLLLRDSLERPSHQENSTSSNATDEFPVSGLFTSFPPIRDPLVTDTSVSQDETAEHCLPFHAGTSGSSVDLDSQGIPRINRENHVNFLNNAIQNAKYIPYDALRPWVIYWSLTGLSVLGADLAKWRDRVLETCAPMQNPGGGFGGGHGQTSHAAPSYAVVLSLAMVGGSGTLDVIDRRAL